MTTQNKPREIEIEFGFEGKMLWPLGSPAYEVKEKVLFREVLPGDAIDRAYQAEKNAALIAVENVRLSDELEALRQELSETKSKLEASEWVRKDNALRTYDGLTERVKELEEFAKNAALVMNVVSDCPYDPELSSKGLLIQALQSRMNVARTFQSSDIYKKVVGK